MGGINRLTRPPVASNDLVVQTKVLNQRMREEVAARAAETRTELTIHLCKSLDERAQAILVAHVKELEAGYDARSAQLDKSYAAALGEMRAAHERSVAGLRAEQAALTKQLRDDHAARELAIRAECATALKRLEASHADREAALKGVFDEKSGFLLEAVKQLVGSVVKMFEEYKQLQPVVHVSVPEQPAPVVNVPAPVVNVTTPTPVVNVTTPAREKSFLYDEHGRPSLVTERTVKEQP